MNFEIEAKSGIFKKQKKTILEEVKLSFTAEFISINHKDLLLKQLIALKISNLTE